MRIAATITQSTGLTQAGRACYKAAMSTLVKICGLNSEIAAQAAAEADFAGFIFFPRSPRYVTPAQAADLARLLPRPVKRVAVLVDPDDATLDQTLAAFDADLIQLHGGETPERVAAIKQRAGRPAIKALPVREAADFAAAASYTEVVDWLMFDAKPPKRRDALPGGNAVSFDWKLLVGRQFARPWFLSGGLTPSNVRQALDITHAPAVDVSSGVEDQPGRKNPFKIKHFIQSVRAG